MARRPPRQMPPEGAVVTFNTVPDVTRVSDLFALAIAMEREAAQRYDVLAGDMEAEGEADLAALFRRLQAEESNHEAGIGAWAARVDVTPSGDLAFRWDSPEGASRDDIDEAGGGSISPWKALAIAVRNEERAFAFYTQVAAKTPDPEVQDYAERMAREELEHVALLRLERRRAWRGEYSATMAALPAAGPPEPSDTDELRAYVRDVELETAGRLRSKAQHARDAQAPDVADLLQDLAEDAEARARAAGAQTPVPEIHTAPGAAGDLMREEEQRLSRLYDAYMRLIETTRDEGVLTGAQEETAVVLARLARLRDERARLRDEV